MKASRSLSLCGSRTLCCGRGSSLRSGLWRSQRRHSSRSIFYVSQASQHELRPIASINQLQAVLTLSSSPAGHERDLVRFPPWYIRFHQCFTVLPFVLALDDPVIRIPARLLGLEDAEVGLLVSDLHFQPHPGLDLTNSVDEGIWHILDDEI